MDYILKSLNQKIELKRVISNDKNERSQFLRVKIEYVLLMLLGYLWNKNFLLLNDDETRRYIITKIVRPSIGTILELCRHLDIDREIFDDKKLSKAFDDYIKLRNDNIGHGYVFEDKISDYILALEKNSSLIENSKIDIISRTQYIVYVAGEDESHYKGISFKPNDLSRNPWKNEKKGARFEVEGLYITENWNTYFKISPFVIYNDEMFYLYRGVEEKLNGRISLTCIDKTGDLTIIWKEFSTFWEVGDSNKKITGNGTIMNIYQNNFSKYISIGVKKKEITSFLKNKSSVSATIWGHGGIGKTATIQSVCQDLSVSEEKSFDYILFLSAKDRFYNYDKAEIEDIDNRIDSYESMISLINGIMFDESQFNEDRIINTHSKILLIIDDFETFSREDQKKVESLINRLNINYHKTIITTRISNLKIGVEIQMNELNENETENFVNELIKNNYQTIDFQQKESILKSNDNYKSIYLITSGRPLFIFQFVAHWMKTNSISDALARDIKSQKNAIDFLYGRLYDSLGKTGKDVFDAISVLVNENDLSHLLDKLKYIVNMEQEGDSFDEAIKQLTELLIINVEKNIFSVHSKEILEIMINSFKEREQIFKDSVENKLYYVGKSKELDMDSSLLITADTYRSSRDETEVESAYRQILNRSPHNKDVQLKALLNLTEYWFNYRGNKEKAISIFEEFQNKFDNEFLFVKMLSNYYWSNGRKREAGNLLTK